MILKASQRGGAKQLAQHLLRTDDNEHVHVHEVQGFLSDELVAAFKEVQAISKGTKCKQPFFSVSLNPPSTEVVDVDVFEQAIAQIEEKNGLAGQPRAIVFHEKEGRRHAHVVWSRIDVRTMTARNLPHFKLKLRDISRALFFEQGWTMPKGLVNSEACDPRNFTLAEWQQSKRIGINARDIKQMVQECWAASDSRSAFENAISERGFTLARGDRRDFVLVSCEGEILGLRTQTGKRTKDLRAKFGSADSLRSVDDILKAISSDMGDAFRRHMAEARAQTDEVRARLEVRRKAMMEAHRAERQSLEDGLNRRDAREARERAARLRGGLSGVWQFLTGTRGRIAHQNEKEAYACFLRDREQRDELIAEQLSERRTIQDLIDAERRTFVRTILLLRSDRTRLMNSSRTVELIEEAEKDRETQLHEPPVSRKRRARRANRPPRGRRQRGPDISPS